MSVQRDLAQFPGFTEVKSPKDYPSGRVFGIQIWSVVTGPYDPGGLMGYQEVCPERFPRTWVTQDYALWLKAMSELFEEEGGHQDAVGFFMERADVTRNVTVAVGGGRGYPRDELGG